MKIAHVATYDLNGGAARAAYRLHQGLLHLGQESLMLVKQKISSDQTVHCLTSELQDTFDTAVQQTSLAAIQSHAINANRTSISNTLFSLPYPGLTLNSTQQIITSDVINLHWIAQFQSIATLRKLLHIGKPIVWTLHDMWAFTGGCHYSSGCEKYQQDCMDCPQLENDEYCLASAVLKDKLSLIADANLVIATPSQWLAECVRKSQLFCHNRVEVIPYGLETEVFKPLPKRVAKELIQLKPDSIALLIGADNGNEQRKGFIELLQALQICTRDPQIQALIQTNQIELLCFGIPNEQLRALDIPVHFLGKIESDQKLSQIYAAADLFVLPSLEDNLPNTLLEAMSCGTTVVAFAVGGIPDLIKEGVTGKTVPQGDIFSLAEAITDCILQRDRREQMAIECRRAIEQNHTLLIQANRYLNLYQEQFDSFQHYSTLGDALRQNSTSSSVTVDTTLGENFSLIFDRLSVQALAAELAVSKTQLQETREKLQQLRGKFQETNAALEQSRSQLQRAESEIAAMQTSKFWRLRMQWLKLKRMLGLDKNHSSPEFED